MLTYVEHPPSLLLWPERLQVLRSSSGTNAQWAGLAGPLSKAINDGLTKAAQRAEAVAALLAAVLIAQADAGSDAAFGSASVWAKASAPESPLLVPSQLSKAAITDALNMVHLAEALLVQVSNLGWHIRIQRTACVECGPCHMPPQGCRTDLQSSCQISCNLSSLANVLFQVCQNLQGHGLKIFMSQRCLRGQTSCTKPPVWQACSRGHSI